MNFHHNHRFLFGTAFALFLALTLAVAIIPAFQNQANYTPLPGSEPLSGDALAGKMLYVANGCVACHTQQVRNVAMDELWGTRPSIAADYAGIGRTDLWRNTATVMGTERTGPDLTSIGSRQPSSAWHLIHLYNPRAVVSDSIMPAYPWLFEEKEHPDPLDTVLNVPDAFKRGTGKIVAKKEAHQLVAYLLALKQTPLPDGTTSTAFLNQPATPADPKPGGGHELVALDGAAAYATNCQACHQSGGTGLPGTFPPLMGSKIVMAESPEAMITIMMKGYNSREREGYPAMPPIATMNNLDTAEIHAIINHARSSWGNDAPAVPLEEVEEIIESLAP